MFVIERLNLKFIVMKLSRAVLLAVDFNCCEVLPNIAG